jgi:hypothetical protein
MCGRFTLRARLNAVAKAFELLDVPELAPRLLPLRGPNDEPD